MNKKYTAAFAVASIVATSLFAVSAFAETAAPEQKPADAGQRPAFAGLMHGRQNAKHSIVGSVATVNGTTLTITVRERARKNNPETTATYTVDASKAIVMKAGASSTVADMQVGDMVMVLGNVNGTTITAIRIMDGFPKVSARAEGNPKVAPNPVFTGNGQPVVAGNVTAISGNTITITNASNATYTIDATSAKVEKANAVSAVSNIAVGDMLVVQGTVNGTSITASTIMDQGVHVVATPDEGKPAPKANKGIFSSVGGFFARLFGF